jgi:putative transposase
MIKERRHSKTEIAAKLVHADDLATRGMLQREIARTLGVSLMTLHRWRRKLSQPPTALATLDEVAKFQSELGSAHQIAELELENSRLRRLVVDLLLEREAWAQRARGK